MHIFVVSFSQRTTAQLLGKWLALIAFKHHGKKRRELDNVSRNETGPGIQQSIVTGRATLAVYNQDPDPGYEVDTTDGVVASGTVDDWVCEETALEAVATDWLWFCTAVIGICDGRV